MERQIFIVYASIVDSTGAWNQLNGYPKKFDSTYYDNDIEKTKQRACGEYHEVLGAMCKRDDRQLQTAMLVSANGNILASQSIGKLADVEPSAE